MKETRLPLVLACGLGLLAARAFALAPDVRVTQYRVDNWTTRDGLPQSSVEAMAQTPDGYLWLGTQEGLVRFDGQQLAVFDKTNTPALLHNRITALLVDHLGGLWIGTEGGGAVRLYGGVWQPVGRGTWAQSLKVRAFAEDESGRVWIAADEGLGHWQAGELTNATDLAAPIKGALHSLFRGRKGMWVGGFSGLLRVAQGSEPEVVAIGQVTALWEDADETLWIGTLHGLFVRPPRARAVIPSAVTLRSQAVAAIFRDRDSNLWIGTDGGLTRFTGGESATLGSRDGLGNDQVLCLFEDREGSLWAGTQDGGANRLANGTFTPFSKIEGLADDVVWPILGDHEGNIWIGTKSGGLSRFKDGRFTSFTTAQGLSSNAVQSLAETADGALWIGTRGGGLDRLKDGRITVYTTQQGLPESSVTALLAGRDGSLWLGTRTGQLACFKNGAFRRWGHADGLPTGAVHFLHEARDGTLWIATNDGLVRLRDGRFRTFTKRDGLSADIVNVVHEDADGSLLIGTFGGGLSRMRGETFRNYTTRDGLFDDAIFSIVEDDLGNLWMSCNKGVFRVAKRELEQLDQKAIPRIEPRVFGVEDGMRNRECNGANQPPAWKDASGRLWFPTIAGVAVVNPAEVRPPTVPLLVHLESVVADGKAMDPRGSLSLASGTRSIELRYAAPSFVAPGRVRYRYTLEGFDPAWVEAGARRVAYYTNLSPGPYRFRVLADRGDGAWSPTGAWLDLQIRPLLYQTLWFRVLGALGVAGAIAAGYRLRVRQMRARERKLQALVATRTRDLQEARDRLTYLADMRARQEIALCIEETCSATDAEQPTVARLRTTATPTRSYDPLPAHPELPTSELVDGRYELRDLVGTGGMGVVYRAYDNELEEFVALKLVREMNPARPSLSALLKQEIRLARKVTHPNVVRTHDLGEARGVPYISMEYVQGITLKQLLKDRGSLPAAVGLGLMKQVCQGLEAAHRMGVVHRDIKPQNVLIVRGTGDVKITDFGIAQMSALDGSPGGLVAGTPTYMSPEQAQGLPTGFASDIYSLGVMLFEVFTGRPPFEGDSATELVQHHIDSQPPAPRSHNPGLPADLDTLILQCLEKDAHRRPASVLAVFLKLEEVSLRYVDESRATLSA